MLFLKVSQMCLIDHSSAVSDGLDRTALWYSMYHVINNVTWYGRKKAIII